LKRERGLRVKRGRILKRKRGTKTDIAVVVDAVAGSRAAILREIIPSAAT
jgi:ribosomal protein L27